LERLIVGIQVFNEAGYPSVKSYLKAFKLFKIKQPFLLLLTAHNKFCPFWMRPSRTAVSSAKGIEAAEVLPCLSAMRSSRLPLTAYPP
jgi:hypothetical protein